MISNKRVLGLIPARGGSKGVPRKNIREIDGKPLIAFSIETAKKSKYLDAVVVSSEDVEIQTISKEWGAETLQRPHHLSQDTTPGVDVVIHALNTYKDYDYVVLLQPTSPLRRTIDIDRAIELCLNSEKPFCVSVTKTEKNPYWMFTIKKDGGLSNILPGKIPNRRQEVESIYVLNGAVYVTDVNWLIKYKNYVYSEAIAYEMPVKYSIDIDNRNDIQYLEFICSRKKQE
ncbi:MAG: acylneuraminate cytidylyltransferase family protein [Proteobacteria bacterium]|nr:acylneuraminate cytidylyltransferase family protein [Pseudomonadota bacterium]NOG59062.1 acylneuraminate cytidylyltransferase family protein [Pseudomonadota bacterium]